jgi:hypothetical protein
MNEEENQKSTIFCLIKMQDSEGFTIVRGKGRGGGDTARKKKGVAGGGMSSAGECLAAREIVARVRRVERSFAGEAAAFAEACWAKLGGAIGERSARLRCRAIGCVGRSEQAQAQCAFALFLQSRLGETAGRPEYVEPLLVDAEKEALRELGFDVAEGATEPTNEGLEVLYCPHAPAGLYHCELLRRWSVEQLAKTVIVGNSFGSYAFRLPKERAPLLALTEPFVTEESLPNNPLAPTAFNDTAVHSFGRVVDVGVPELSAEQREHNDPEFIA